MKEWEHQACMLFFMSDKDVTESWRRVLEDDMVSAGPESVLRLWQQLLQMQDNELVSVLFQYMTSRQVVKTKVLLFTQEENYLLVCNGIGGDSLVNVTYEEMIDLCNWWSGSPTVDVPLQAHPVYRKVFRCDTNVKSIHLFTDTHTMSSNTNLRLAQFNRICEAASHKAG